MRVAKIITVLAKHNEGHFSSQVSKRQKVDMWNALNSRCLQIWSQNYFSVKINNQSWEGISINMQLVSDWL